MLTAGIATARANAVYATLHNFVYGEGSDLALASDGNLYGTTQANNVYELSPDGAATNLYTLTDAEGYVRGARLSTADGGTIFGVSGGSIFRVLRTTTPVVALTAPVPKVSRGSGLAGKFLVSLSIPQPKDIVASFHILKGEQYNAYLYGYIPSLVTIPAGQTSQIIQVYPVPRPLDGNPKIKVQIALDAGLNYTVDATRATAQVVIAGGN